jgi:hypothetical protein
MHAVSDDELEQSAAEVAGRALHGRQLAEQLLDALDRASRSVGERVQEIFKGTRLGKRSRNQYSMNRILFKNSASTFCSSSSSPQPRQNPISRSIDIETLSHP